MSLTIAQKTNYDGFPKPGELIEITGAHGLEALDRALVNSLYQYAHDSGKLSDVNADWEISLSQLRPSTHESNDRLRDALHRIISVAVEVPYIDPENGDQRFLITPLFEFFDVAAADAVKRPTLKFGIPPKLRPVLARSNRWGRIKAEVVCAMSSRYAVALYELVQLRARMERSLEVFAVDRFRSLLGVPPESYQRGNDFVRFVLEPAALEVNGLSDLGVTVEVRRKGPRAPIEAVAVAWWRKEGDAFREALKERDRSKLGRTARLRGEVEAVTVSSRVTGTARKRL
jgi:hypothetical protein